MGNVLKSKNKLIVWESTVSAAEWPNQSVLRRLKNAATYFDERQTTIFRPLEVARGPKSGILKVNE